MAENATQANACLESLSPELRAKLDALRDDLRQRETIAVCFSGGVDSTLLLAVAAEQLPAHVLAITETNALYPARETDEAVAFCQALGVDHILANHDPQDIEGFAQNPKNRCYLCKNALFGHIRAEADRWARGKGFIRQDERLACAEGSNASDLAFYRPGRQAVKEHGILSPLEDAGLSKQEIRQISRAWGLHTWEKPSFACLASRFAYNEPITAALLKRVDAAEQLFINAGFAQARVRVHDNARLARVEVPRELRAKAFAFLDEGACEQLHDLGFSHVSLDMDGYRSGSMDE